MNYFVIKNKKAGRVIIPWVAVKKIEFTKVPQVIQSSVTNDFVKTEVELATIYFTDGSTASYTAIDNESDIFEKK